MDYSNVEKGHLSVEVRPNKVAIATLNRPDRLNSMGDGMHEAIEEFLHMVNYDRDVNAVVFTGAGRAFCAGGDVKAMGDRATGAAEKLDPGNLLRGAKYIVQRFVNCEVPLIAAINGHAVGLGATIGLLCDVTFIAEDAKIGDNHVRVGITAGDGGALIWPYLIGVHKAKDMLMSGRLITGREAHELGVTNYCYPKEEVLDRAIAYAEEIAAGARGRGALHQDRHQQAPVGRPPTGSWTSASSPSSSPWRRRTTRRLRRRSRRSGPRFSPVTRLSAFGGAPASYAQPKKRGRIHAAPLSFAWFRPSGYLKPRSSQTALRRRMPSLLPYLLRSRRKLCSSSRQTMLVKRGWATSA